MTTVKEFVETALKSPLYTHHVLIVSEDEIIDVMRILGENKAIRNMKMQYTAQAAGCSAYYQIDFDKWNDR